METVLSAAKQETEKLTTETESPATDVKYEPRAWTREGRSD